MAQVLHVGRYDHGSGGVSPSSVLSKLSNRSSRELSAGQIEQIIADYVRCARLAHEKMLKFATGIGMGGLGYLEVQEDLSYKGPIDKFIPDDLKAEMRELAGLEALDTIFFIADKEERAASYAGQIRTELGNRLDICEKNAYRFCFVNDFPMFEL